MSDKGPGFHRIDLKGFLRRWEMHKAGRARGCDLHARWRQAAGARDAEHTRVRSFNKGVLRVVIDSSALLQNLMSRKAELTRRMNQDGAAPVVTEIRFEIGSPGAA